MNQRFDMAAIAIFIAAVLDSLDGRVARIRGRKARSAPNSTASPTW
jgi:phosphatidylserine synthase